MARPELAGLVLHDIRGLLDFYYCILTGTSPLGTRADTVTIWLPPPAGITVTYADFRPDGLGDTAPDKFISGAPDNKYTFIFSKGVPADTSTRFFFVSTNAWNGNHLEGSGPLAVAHPKR